MNALDEVKVQFAPREGGNIPITLACALYDRMQALYTGAVQVEGIDLNFMVEDFPRRLFDSEMTQQQFDVCEMSTSDYITKVDSGNSPFVAIPVFPSKCFRHNIITINRKSGIKEPKDLQGRRVGVMRFTMTAAVWQRGHLENDYGVDLKSIHWVEGSVNSKGSHGVPTIIPPGFNVEINHSDFSLSELLEQGKIDAIIGTHLPASLKTNPDVVRLFPNYKEVEIEYYKRTGIFPIMHLIVIKKKLYDAHPFIAKSLFNAFESSKKAALLRMKNYSALRYMLPWMTEEIDQLEEVFGEDPWTYGLETNSATINTMMKFMVQQGMIKKVLSMDDLFVSVK
jgi:4,5-dihydroxyphthalate decarboxylase